ncbi:MAG: glycosyltransferase family 9 protein [Nanoarchaeota archaeon]|nr:glycosyltransferase family 9 protein [Nanoarchaeota archaeon]
MVKSILMIKLGAAGDVLRTTCILQGLKEQHPDAGITWITKPFSKPLLAYNSLISQVVAVQDISQLGSFDLVINLDEDELACKFASKLRSGAEFKGFYWDEGVKFTEGAEPWFMMSALGPEPQNDVLKKENKKTYQEHMLDIVGLKPEKSETLYYMTEDDEQLTEEFREKIGPGYVIGFNTGAGSRWPLKRLSIEKTVKLAEHLSKDAKIVLFGGPEETERNKKIIGQAKCDIIDAGTDNTLRQFAAKLSAVDLLITSDTLALHIRIALKKRIVAFFGPTSAAEVELYGLGEKVHADVECYCCYKKDPIAQPSCADAITVEMILKAVERVRNV